eukprot:c6395_g1_i1.p1 GENE.c6395_g1_i1~~c6395_g1_i1.p1  ORF type:complete len:285 (-),score=59.09 c6395_g1_i1:190-1044(-)
MFCLSGCVPRPEKHKSSRPSEILCFYSHPIGLGGLTEKDVVPQQKLAGEIRSSISGSTTAGLIVLWGALFHKLKHLKHHEQHGVDHFKASLVQLVEEQSDVQPFLRELLAIHKSKSSNLQVVWFREVFGIKPSWTTSFAKTDKYIVDLGSGQVNIVDTTTGLQLSEFAYPFDFATVDTAIIVQQLASFIAQYNIAVLRLFATGKWRVNANRFSDLQRSISQAGLDVKLRAEILFEATEAKCGAQSVANVLDVLRERDSKFPSFEAVLVVESGKGSTQWAVVVKK